MDADPPAQDSPKNILNILDDDCIEEILRRLKKLEDLLNAASACKRFRETAKSLKWMFRSVAIEDVRHIWIAATIVSAELAPTLLRNFGHLIESVEWKPKRNRERNDEMFKLIVKFCGKTLKRLVISNYNPQFNKRNRLQALERLELYEARPKNFRLDSHLKYLRIRLSSLKQQPWFIRPFPHLENVRFELMKLTDDMLTKFLSFNQQLRVLQTDADTLLSPMVLESIGHYSRNIETLHIHSFNFMEFESTIINEKLLYLNALRKLMDFWLRGELSLELLLNMFAENGAPIWSLGIFLTPIDTAPSFPTIKTLNNLHIRCPHGISDDFLINLVKSQSALKTLSIINEDRTVTIQRIKKILEFGKNLTEFEFCMYHSELDLETYNTILGLARHRVKVEITCSKSKVYVPEDILKANSKWLCIYK